ncbi:TonB-dependent receptor [Methylopila jiangsuensis]|uniref:TonB-dependent receptor n=2 Tax=Methylopila jiangsuensis TaxID=586230 RepID=A0A9W6JJS8_9HYPH|nr:TonB-dependent receptor [Methylopila jiangsuensis]
MGTLRLGMTGAAVAGTALLAVTPAVAQSEEARRQAANGQAQVQRVAQSHDAVALDEIRVEGAGSGRRAPSTGTLGQPPAAYAGGQVATGARLGMLGNRSILETPFSISGYTEKLIRDQQASSIVDVAQNDPSVRNDAPTFSERDAFMIRGFSVTNLDVAYDGLFYIANARRHFLEGVERVEILKGPSAFLNGGVGRVGGTINLVPKRATDEPLTRVTTSFNSDSLFGTHVDVGRRFGANKEWGIRFNGSYRNGDTTLDKNEVEVGVAALGLDYSGERFRASLDLNHSTQNLEAPTSLFNAAAPGFDIPRAPKNKNTANSFEYHDSTYNMAAARVEYDILPETTVYAAAGASRYREDFLTSSYRILNRDGDATATLAIQPQQIQGFTGEAGVRSKFQTGFLGHRLSVSASKALNENYRGGFAPASVVLPAPYPTNIYHPSGAPGGRVDTGGFPRSDDLPLFADLLLTSVAVSDTLSVVEDRVQLTVGGRYQHIKSRGFNTRPDRGVVGERNYYYEDERFSPAVAVMARVTENFSVYASYVEALTEGPTASGTPLTVTNAGQIYPPVVNKQREVGAKYDFGSFLMTAALFEIRQPNGFVTPAPVGANDPRGTFGLNGRQVNRGLELTVAGEPIEGLRLLGGVSFLDPELEKTVSGTFDGNDVPGVARTTVTLYGEYDLPWFARALTVTSRIVYNGKTYYDQANTQRVKDWTRFDLGARYAFTGPLDKPVVIRANVQNVFNKAYWSSSARGFLAAGAGRTFMLSAAVDF